MSENEKHPRHIRFRSREKEARAGIDFGRHVTATRAPRAIPLVVLLALIVVIGGYVGSRVLREAGSGEAPSPSLLERPFGPISPSGEAAREGLVFTWGPHPVASGYELVLEDGEGRTVWAARLGRETTALALPPDLAGTLEAGRPYLWTVTAELPGGEREASRSLAFVAP